MRITELRIEGLRTIERARLSLDGLTVLIGENGSGKSSIIEACEILRRASGERFLDELYGIHGGMGALLRQGAPHLRLGVTVHDRPSKNSEASKLFETVRYDLTLLPTGPFASIRETIRVRRAPTALHLTSRRAQKGARVRGEKGNAGAPIEVVYESLDGEAPFPAKVGTVDEEDDTSSLAAILVRHALRSIHVHLPFETMPTWAARALDRKSALRTPSLFAPANHLEKLGLNLANAFHTLKNQFGRDAWQRTLEYVRLGLGDRIEDVTTWADPGGGNIGLAIKQRGLDQPVPAAQLSDGMLAYLAFVALFRLRQEPPSLLALDEPDLHLHPRLLMRVIDFLEGMGREHPVLVATHSDRLLDGLSDPARSVVLCELDERDTTRLLRPDAAALARWLERYRGLGDIRGAGHEASIFTEEEKPEADR